jgi:hypothetical protein
MTFNGFGFLDVLIIPLFGAPVVAGNSLALCHIVDVLLLPSCFALSLSKAFFSTGFDAHYKTGQAVGSMTFVAMILRCSTWSFSFNVVLKSQGCIFVLVFLMQKNGSSRGWYPIGRS